MGNIEELIKDIKEVIKTCEYQKHYLNDDLDKANIQIIEDDLKEALNKWERD